MSNISTITLNHAKIGEIAAFCLEASSKDLEFDLETLGFLFENMVIRDLKVYAESIGGNVGHYLDKNGVEVDAIVHLRNGKWGTVEIKLGYNRVESASKKSDEIQK